MACICYSLTRVARRLGSDDSPALADNDVVGIARCEFVNAQRSSRMSMLRKYHVDGVRWVRGWDILIVAGDSGLDI